MENSDLLKTRLKELQAVNRLFLKRNFLEAPSKNFTHKVMEGLENSPVRSGVNYRSGLLLLMGIILASGLALWLLSYGAFDGAVTTLVVDVKNNWIASPKVIIPFNAKMLVNGIIFLNLAIALILLDRTVFKPLFHKRALFDY
jgi:hypothetical protein